MDKSSRQITTTSYLEGDVKDNAQVAAGNISNKNQTISHSTVHGSIVNADTVTDSFNSTAPAGQTADL